MCPSYLPTLNFTFAFFLPRFAVQVMVTLPFFLNVTTPSLLTVATFLLLDFHLKPPGLVFSGTTGVRVTLSPFFTAVAGAVSVTLAGTVGSLMTSVTVRFFLPTFMVILTLPPFFTVTRPLASTVATFLLEDLNFLPCLPFRSSWIALPGAAVTERFVLFFVAETVCTDADAVSDVGAGAGSDAGAGGDQVSTGLPPMIFVEASQIRTSEGSFG